MEKELIEHLLKRGIENLPYNSKELNDNGNFLLWKTVSYLKNNSKEQAEQDFTKNTDYGFATYINDLKASATNYNVPALILNILSSCYEKEFQKENIKGDKRAIKYLNNIYPYLFLEWDNAIKDLPLLESILEYFDISFDEKQLKQEFEKQQIVKLINNNIFSEKDLKEHSYENMPMGFQDIELNVGNNIRKLFALYGKQYGFAKVKDYLEKKENWSYSNNLRQRKIGFRKEANPKVMKPMNKAVFILANECGIIFPENIKKHDYYFYSMRNEYVDKTMFVPDQDCKIEEIKQIEKRNKKFQKFVNKVKNSKNKKYDEPGVITIAITGNNDINEKNETAKKVFQIEITRRELINYGILPEEIGWGLKKKVQMKQLVLDDGNFSRKRIEFSKTLQVKDTNNKKLQLIKKNEDKNSKQQDFEK